MVLMGEDGEGAQETSLSPVGCGGGQKLRVSTFVDCTRQAWSRVGVGLQCPKEHTYFRGIWLN